MYLLDTDTISNVSDHRRASALLQARIASEPPENLHISMVTLAESSRGWLDMINRAQKPPRNGTKLIRFYMLFQTEVEYMMQYNMLPYDETAEEAYQTIPAPMRKQHPQDCHIAAIALSRGLIVVTSNLSHFRQIPGIQCEDWKLEQP